MTAFHSMIFSGFGNAEIPSGTSVFRRLRSLTSRRRAFVDWTKLEVSYSARNAVDSLDIQAHHDLMK
jgi:hypothetical protein